MQENKQGPNQPDKDKEKRTEDDIVVLQFKGNRKGYYNNFNNVEIAMGDHVLVQADRGKDMGKIIYIGKGNKSWWDQTSGLGVIGHANEAQLKMLHDNRADEWEYYDICLEKIQLRRLNMNLVSVEKQFDRNKITFFFTADKRVDFRLLVKDLASIFRTRIELRQIGVRDEARMKGGLGLCGRELCCSSFLEEFSPVTLKMAKTQQLPMSPAKLSGLCGRLRCCLAYENDEYEEIAKRMPQVGDTVTYNGQDCPVNKLDMLSEKVTIWLEGEREQVQVSTSELEWQGKNAGGCGGCCKNKTEQ
jgi:cell fate regulator YaaT (PSP1 superfamily)